MSELTTPTRVTSQYATEGMRLVRNSAGLWLAEDAIPDQIDAIIRMIARGNLNETVLSAGWTQVLVGSGSGAAGLWRSYLATGATPSSSCVRYAGGGGYFAVNWSKRLIAILYLLRATADSEAVSYVQIKDVNTIGPLAAVGLGLKIEDRTLKGESFGSSGADIETDLATYLTSTVKVQVALIHLPGVSTSWYVNGVLKGAVTDTTKIPSGVSPTESYIVISHANGATGRDSALQHSRLWVWQED